MKNWIRKLHFSSASIPLACTQYRKSLSEHFVIRMLKYVIYERISKEVIKKRKKPLGGGFFRL